MAEMKEVICKQPESVTNKYRKDDLLQTTKISATDESETSPNSETESFPGSTILRQLNKLEVVQRLDTLEVCLGWTRNNRYCAYNEEGEQIFYIYEASDCFSRQLTGALRPLVLKVSLCDEDQENVLFLHRPRACSSRCCWFCCNLQHMEVTLPANSASGSRAVLLATVEEVWSCCIPQYHLTDGKGEGLWLVRGGACHCRCCCQIEFQFVRHDGEEMASITRSCHGCKEIIGAANSFTIEFSERLTPRERLIVLGGTFLIDLNYFEKQNKCW